MKRGDSFIVNKGGQVTVFIIAAILIVALVVLIYFLRPGTTVTTGFDEKSPNEFIQICIENDLEDTVNLISSQGGSVNPENFILYQDDKIEYLCYTTEYYKTCSVQRPLLKEHIESEIENEIKPAVVNCFNELKNSYESRGYTVNLRPGNVRVELLPKRVVARFNYTLTTTKTDTERYDSFNVVLNNGLYELVSIANSIIDWESEFGDAETTLYMSYYPDLKVEKLNQVDGSTIYILTDRNTGNKFQFASRSVAWPPGYGIDEVATN
ncbi:hypothetical protein J4422_02805 [Candidatus Pacearchaeota archaeon]|nr:hypothetical protein [Candidatus Pacearchaeota archaeon]